MLTQAELKKYINYNHENGFFKRIFCHTNFSKNGTFTGNKTKAGYIVISLKGKLYLAHRLAWLYIYGYIPKNDIDHINGIKDDNRIENLRECTPSENLQNIGKSKNNTVGFMGVTYRKDMGLFRAQIVLNNKNYHIGNFKTAEEAGDAYLKAKAKLHKFQPTPRM